MNWVSKSTPGRYGRPTGSLRSRRRQVEPLDRAPASDVDRDVAEIPMATGMISRRRA